MWNSANTKDILSAAVGVELAVLAFLGKGEREAFFELPSVFELVILALLGKGELGVWYIGPVGLIRDCSHEHREL